jgi:clan AA aspartic protease (TIGR02281 family)
MNPKALIFVSFVLFCAGYARADTVYLKNGKNMEGIIKTQGNDFIELEVSGGLVKLQKEEVAWIVESSDGVRAGLREKWTQDHSGAEPAADEQQPRVEPLSSKADFTRGQDGMVVNAIVNGKINVGLVLDTGASLVVLRKSLAKELGIDLSDVNPDTKTILANGTISQAKHIMLRSLEIEGLKVDNVDAAILVDDDQTNLVGDGLLGMSFLSHFNFKIDQKANKLILEKPQE